MGERQCSGLADRRRVLRDGSLMILFRVRTAL
jgi:hypothetical protein